MSIVGDLREALQDVVAPDLKAMVRGLADLREEMRSNNAPLRDDIAASERRTSERIAQSERRTEERLDRIHDAIKIADLTRRYEDLLRENQQLRNPQAPQQH